MELKFDEKKSEYRKVNILINSAYKVRDCWTLEQEHIFKSSIYPKLEEKGFRIRKSETAYASETINEPGGAYLYLHPMNFSGYLKPEEIDTVVEIINSSGCATVYNVNQEEVYDISDGKYEDILADNLDMLVKYMEKHPYDDGFAFAEKFRIPRYRDKTGRCSDDTDVHFYNIFKKIRKKEKELLV